MSNDWGSVHPLVHTIKRACTPSDQMLPGSEPCCNDGAGRTITKLVARAHDITHTLLMIWVDKFRHGELTEEIDYMERARETEAKIAALERKVGQLIMERDALKKVRHSAGVNNEKVSVVSGPLACPALTIVGGGAVGQ